MTEPNPPRKYDDGNESYPRSIVIGVITLSVLILFVVVSQLKNNLIIDFPDLGGVGIVEDNTANLLEETDEQLKLQDSDGDGLSDFDELRIYGTSPFIADTDSDGVTDIAEIKAGTDPTCPEGEDCFGGGGNLASDKSTDSRFETPEVKALLENPAELRALLISSGADPIVVGNLDDLTLQAVGKQAFDALSNPTPQKIEFLQNLDAEQVRTLLVASGADISKLGDISDEDLLQIYNQALSAELIF